MTRKRFLMLRYKMDEMGVNHAWLADKLCCSRTYISQRIAGKESWTMWEAHFICNLLKIPVTDLLTYFPVEDMLPPKRMTNKINTLRKKKEAS